jgi:hypothetical protein
VFVPAFQAMQPKLVVAFYSYLLQLYYFAYKSLYLYAMQTFKLNTEELNKKLLKRSIVTVIIALIVWFTFFFAQGGTLDYPMYIIIPIVFIMGLIGFSIWQGMKKQKALFESYEITISDQLICREQLNTADISILVSEVVEIATYPKGGFSIKGSRNNGTIIIPPQIQNYEQLQATLQQIHPIILKPTSFAKKFIVPLTLLSISLMLCVYLVDDKIIVGASGALLTVLIIWSLVWIQRNKNVDRKTKNSMWIVLLVLASIIASTILKITA